MLLVDMIRAGLFAAEKMAEHAGVEEINNQLVAYGLAAGGFEAAASDDPTAAVGGVMVGTFAATIGMRLSTPQIIAAAEIVGEALGLSAASTIGLQIGIAAGIGFAIDKGVGYLSQTALGYLSSQLGTANTFGAIAQVFNDGSQGQVDLETAQIEAMNAAWSAVKQGLSSTGETLAPYINPTALDPNDLSNAIQIYNPNGSFVETNLSDINGNVETTEYNANGALTAAVYADSGNDTSTFSRWNPGDFRSTNWTYDAQYFAGTDPSTGGRYAENIDYPWGSTEFHWDVPSVYGNQSWTEYWQNFTGLDGGGSLYSEIVNYPWGSQEFLWDVPSIYGDQAWSSLWQDFTGLNGSGSAYNLGANYNWGSQEIYWDVPSIYGIEPWTEYWQDYT